MTFTCNRLDRTQQRDKPLSDIRYGVWRDYDPEATLVFYALRMHEIGIIKSRPKEIVAASVDWRFFNELRSELKT